MNRLIPHAYELANPIAVGAFIDDNAETFGKLSRDDPSLSTHIQTATEEHRLNLLNGMRNRQLQQPQQQVG